jgi:hypothetical protein
MRIFICDNCKREFPEPLDQEKHTDIHGVTTNYDLCAPCRKKLKDEKAKPVTGFFAKIKEKK